MNTGQRLIAVLPSVFLLGASMTFPASVHAQSSGVTLWNKLDGGTSAVASEIGPALSYYDPGVDGPGVVGTVNFVPGRFGNAVTLGPGSFYPTARVRALVLRDLRGVLNPERGTIAVWYREKERPVPYEHNNYLMFGGGFDLLPPVQLQNSNDGTNPNLQFVIRFGGERTVLDAWFTPPLNEWVHLAAVWDRRGIDGTAETVRLYVNGTRVSATTVTSWGTGFDDNNVDIAGGNDLIQEKFALDNMVVYDYAKTDFSDRFDENPLGRTIAWVKASTTDEVIDALLMASGTGTPTTIKVAPGRYVFLDNDSSPAWGVLPAISTSVWIVGTDAATTTFESKFEGHILTVTKSGSLKVRNLTITRGGGGLDGGGAAANYGGFLRFDGCRIVGNGTGAERGALGGAIMSVGGRLHIENTLLTGNRVDGNGGAIALIGGSAILRNVIVEGNIAYSEPSGGVGGGIYASKATLTIIDSTIVGNRAGDIGGLSHQGYGGGIFSDGILWMRNSAVIKNGVEYIGRGGGIYSGGVMSIKDSTVAANYAGTFGGGIFNRGKLTLQGVTIADNEADGAMFGCDDLSTTPCSGGGGLWNEGSGSIRAVRSVVAGNQIQPYGFPGSAGPDCAGIVLSDGNNAIGDASGCDLRPSWVLKGQPTNDLVGVDPTLGVLQDNGQAGNARIPLLDHSPLIDAGGVISKTCAALDQIGQPRVDGDGDRKRECDIGAIEYQLPQGLP
jgi:hypothetical protein